MLQNLGSTESASLLLVPKTYQMRCAGNISVGATAGLLQNEKCRYRECYFLYVRVKSAQADTAYTSIVPFVHHTCRIIDDFKYLIPSPAKVISGRNTFSSAHKQKSHCSHHIIWTGTNWS